MILERGLVEFGRVDPDDFEELLGVVEDLAALVVLLAKDDAHRIEVGVIAARISRLNRRRGQA